MFTLKSKHTRVVMFHVNDPKPSTVYFDHVQYLMVDGDELELVRSQFDNLPITKGNVCTWSGEMAQFIFRNVVLNKNENRDTEASTK